MGHRDIIDQIADAPVPSPRPRTLEERFVTVFLWVMAAIAVVAAVSLTTGWI